MKSAPPKSRAPACPICKKPVDPAYRPFCSKRCADVDLQRHMKQDRRMRSHRNNRSKRCPRRNAQERSWVPE